MGTDRAGHLRAAGQKAERPTKGNRAKKTLLTGAPVVLAAGVLAGYFVLVGGELTKAPVAGVELGSDAAAPLKFTRVAATLDDLLALPVENLVDVDIAEMNLLCAVGLPGAENLDIDHALATLDQWAARVKFETERHLYRVKEPRWAEHYRHSEAYLRAEFLLQVLQEDLGIRYDMTAADNFDFDDSRVAFIHGMIPGKGQTVADTKGGTCASMPVLYAAVGRRLGYPLKLVTTNAHLFVRWDGANHAEPKWRARFNIEGAGNGFSSFEDDYYKTWPFRTTDRQVRMNHYLVSLAPNEELAEFLAARGHCARDSGRLALAARCYENAYRLDSSRPYFGVWFVEVARTCSYRPSTPALAAMLTRRREPLATAERIIANQQIAAREAWLREERGLRPVAPGMPHIPAGGTYPPFHDVRQPYIPAQPPAPPQLPGPYRPAVSPSPPPAQPPRP